MDLINELIEQQSKAPNNQKELFDLAIKWLKKYLIVKGDKAEERVALFYFKQCMYRLGMYDEWVFKLNYSNL